jgi:hypothetical protein
LRIVTPEACHIPSGYLSNFWINTVIFHGTSVAETGVMESQFHAMADAAPEGNGSDGSSPASPRKRILVVSRTGALTAELMTATLNIAERLGLDVVCLYIDPLPRKTDPISCRPTFAVKARINTALLVEKARRRGVPARTLITSGKVTRAVSNLVAASRGIAFVVLEPGIASREIKSILSIPVFAAVVESTSPGRSPFSSIEWLARPSGIVRSGLKFFNITSQRGGEQMAGSVSRKKIVQKTFVFGAAAAALYAAVFHFADPLMALVSRGKLYAMVPVGTVFLFSYIHGNFTSYFWSALGIEASKRTGVQPTVKPPKRKDTRPRARLSV